MANQNFAKTAGFRSAGHKFSYVHLASMQDFKSALIAESFPVFGIL